MYRNDMYDYLKEHAYISKNKKSNYQFELSEERAECIANKFNSLVIDLYQQQWLGRIERLEKENQKLINQQKEFIEWSENEIALRERKTYETAIIKDDTAVFVWKIKLELLKEVLSKYKEIEGYKE